MRRSQPWRTNRARALRSTSTSAEDRLWQELRDRQLEGLKFVRQHPIGPYFADFACRARKLVVEIDGGTHSGTREVAKDKSRSAFLRRRGYRIFRVHNQEIYDDIDGVMSSLLEFAAGDGDTDAED